MMIALQIISKILTTQDLSIIQDNLLTKDYFPEYGEEYEFIMDHYKKYGNVPDKATFLSQFSDLELVEVTESDEYLVDGIREQYLFEKSVPIMKKVSELLQTNANAAAEYMLQAIKTLQPNYGVGGIDIVHAAKERYNQFVSRKEKQDDWFFTTGFSELDDLIHGIQRQEEFIVIVARTNEGKSWVLEKMCTHVWELGFSPGYISPEMGASSIGYRFDTLHKNFSNRGLIWGKNDIDEDSYSSYIEELRESKNHFIVSTPADFDKKITITKIRNWVKKNDLDLVAIDGITYLSDERYQRGDTKTTSLTNISEDLMELSIELGVPVIVVVQANRSGIISKDDNDSVPELESIRDSDGIAHNASKVLSLRRKDEVLMLQVKKHRNGPVGGKLTYQWDVDKGEFNWIPSYEDACPSERREQQIKETRKKFSDDKEDVF